jgi:pantoate ligase / CMP/dCMP kinase
VQIFKTIAGLRCYLKANKQDNLIGLVPTMGALHQGHESLIKRAISETDLVVVSIFINPLQFNPQEDLDKYPRQLEKDIKTCEEWGVNVIFSPELAEIYDQKDTIITTETLTKTTQVIPPQSMMNILCGKSRPGHFEGVATIVIKLFNIVRPNIAYFGEKDGQQLAIIRRLVKDLNIPIEIKGCGIIREKSGLALSSRNQYLTPIEKEKASILYQSLHIAKMAFQNGERNGKILINLVAQKLKSVTEINVDYLNLVDCETLEPLTEIETRGLLAIAVYLGKTRLIDNIILRDRQPIIAIDGPAGAGKSTVTRKIAEKLNLLYLDTGAMYRAVTWLVINQGIELNDEAKIAEILSQSNLELNPPFSPDDPIQVKINGEDITKAIRSPEISRHVSTIAAQNAVREILVKKQQKWGEKGGIVAEGRDIGTHVFPDAELKIFLVASVEERAKRRLKDLENQGYKDINLQELEKEIQQRDHKDSSRKITPLKKANDAIEVNTDHLTIDQVVEKIISLL